MLIHFGSSGKTKQALPHKRRLMDTVENIRSPYFFLDSYHKTREIPRLFLKKSVPLCPPDVVHLNVHSKVFVFFCSIFLFPSGFFSCSTFDPQAVNTYCITIIQ